MARTIRSIVQQLRAAGIKITLYERPDGGILIRSIDGVKFTGAQGNKRAREMLGVELSAAQQTQLASAMTTRLSRRRPLPDYIMKKVRRTQRYWRKYKPEVSKGRITMKKVRYSYMHYGAEETIRRLSAAERYARGLAYDVNIEYFLQRLNAVIYSGYVDNNTQLNELYTIRDAINAKRITITEVQLKELIEAMYMLEQALAEGDEFKAQAAISRMREILGAA